MALSPIETTDGKLSFKHQRAQKLDNLPDTFNCWCHQPACVFGSFNHEVFCLLFGKSETFTLQSWSLDFVPLLFN